MNINDNKNINDNMKIKDNIPPQNNQLNQQMNNGSQIPSDINQGDLSNQSQS